MHSASPVAASGRDRLLIWASIGLLTLLAWAYLVVFGSLLAFNAYMVLLARVSGGLASSYTFVNPVIALLLGVWLAGEVVTAFEWLSTAVILLGVVLLMARHRP